jgi:hypothetical protein
MGRHERRADLARYRRETSGVLVTYLVPPNDRALDTIPLLRRATDAWLEALAVKVRSCIVCSSWLVNRHHVGAVLLSTPTVMPRAASVCGVCRECWEADLPADALERAALTALKVAIPGAHFEEQR